MIYLDNAATTKAHDCVVSAVAKVLSEDYFNPSALYLHGTNVKTQIEQARETIATQLKVNANEIYFTSGATESNTWVFNSAIKNKKGNVVISAGEHASVFNNAVNLKSKGVEVRICPLTNDGRIDFNALKNLVDNNTTFVSVIHCSNETGVINDIAQVVAYVKSVSPNCLVHSDGVQAFCKIDTDCKNMGVDFYSISGHKIGAIKGIGALYVKKPVKIAPLIIGGGQESGMRSGTENVAGIIGFKTAVEYYAKNYDINKVSIIHKKVVDLLKSCGAVINGEDNNSKAIISASFSGIRAEVLQHVLCDCGVCIGLGSACSSKERNNRVLSAMNVGEKAILGSIRISFDVNSVLDDVVNATKIIINKARELGF